jgi:hypothetical protein
MPLTPQDEFIHAIAPEPTWREALYFDFYDPATRLCAFGYLGVHPNQQIGDVIFALWKGDVLLTSFTRWDFNIPSDIGEERFGFGPLFFRPLDPFKTWEIYFDNGYCRMDVTFSAIHPPYNWADAHAGLSSSNSHHYEQQGRYTGTVRAGETTYSINAVGARDHAWGWGARAGIRRWLWASAQFSPQFAWNTFQLTLADGRELLYGYIFRGKQNELIRASRSASSYCAKGKAPRQFEVELQGRDGGHVAATADTINSFNTSFQERNKTGYHFFCFTEYKCEGLVGFGQSNFHWRKDEDCPREWQVNV